MIVEKLLGIIREVWKVSIFLRKFKGVEETLSQTYFSKNKLFSFGVQLTWLYGHFYQTEPYEAMGREERTEEHWKVIFASGFDFCRHKFPM